MERGFRTMKYAKLRDIAAPAKLAAPCEGDNIVPTATAAVKGIDKYTISLSSNIALIFAC